MVLIMGKIRSLFSLTLVALGLFSLSAQEAKTTAKTAPLTRNVDVGQFDQLRGKTNTVVLDVRTASEYAEGHLQGAVLLDYRSPDFAEKVARLDKSKQYLVHCAAGARSARACTKMESLGFTNLVNLEGGYGAWKDAGKPTVK